MPALLWLIIARVVAASNCDTHTNCGECAANSSWTGYYCRWCPLQRDHNCHAEGSLVNPCSGTQDITDSSRCAAANTNKPTQVHIALGGKGAMTVSWQTNNLTNTSTVVWGRDGLLAETTVGDAMQYLPPSTHHHVTLTGLTPATVYQYKCGDAEGGYSKVFSFKSAPPPKTAFSASVFGDWGYGTNGHAVETRRQLENIKDVVDFTWHLGDIGYADDAFLHDATGFEYENVYDGFMNWIENISASKPYMVAPGNHECECHSPACLSLTSSTYRDALSNFSAYNTRWRMPAEASEARKGQNLWYSFDYGLAHFVSLNTETDFPGAGEETKGGSKLLASGGFGEKGELVKWLEADLTKANANRANTPWLFVGGHRPIYDAAASDPVMQRTFEHLFMKYDVDAYFSGHKHSYASSWPTCNNVSSHSFDNPTCPVYVLVGGAGCDEMDDNQTMMEDHKQYRLDNTIFEDAGSGDFPWNRFADSSHYGTGMLDVYNSTTVRWRYILSKDGSVKDEIVIRKL